MELFSSVTNMSTIAILLLTTLHMEDHGWICGIFNVEVAFLDAELETPMYVEWPESMIELGFISEQEGSNKFIK